MHCELDNWLTEDREELDSILHLSYKVVFYTWNYKGTRVSLIEELEFT